MSIVTDGNDGQSIDLNERLLAMRQAQQGWHASPSLKGARDHSPPIGTLGTTGDASDEGSAIEP